MRTSDHCHSRTLQDLHDQKVNRHGFDRFDQAQALEAELGGLSHETSQCSTSLEDHEPYYGWFHAS